jgi:hypothetical protein
MCKQFQESRISGACDLCLLWHAMSNFFQTLRGCRLATQRSVLTFAVDVMHAKSHYDVLNVGAARCVQKHALFSQLLAWVLYASDCDLWQL